MKKVFLLAIIIFSLGCKNNIAKETKARITERRLLENGKLRISYIFKAGFTTVAGIAQVNNTILPVDSIKVVHSPKNPQDNSISY